MKEMLCPKCGLNPDDFTDGKCLCGRFLGTCDVPAGALTLPYLASTERRGYDPPAEKPNLPLLKAAIRHLSAIENDLAVEDTERLITIALYALEMLVEKLRTETDNSNYRLLVPPPEPEEC